MEVFANKKRRRIFWIYIGISLPLFIWSSFSLNGMDKLYGNPFGYTSLRSAYLDNFYSAHFFVLIPLTYLIIFAIMVMKWNQYRAHIKRYQSFYDLKQEEQNDILAKVFCKECKAYHQASFSDEKMIDGMRWVYCNCAKCGTENKVRLS